MASPTLSKGLGWSWLWWASLLFYSALFCLKFIRKMFWSYFFTYFYVLSSFPFVLFWYSNYTYIIRPYKLILQLSDTLFSFIFLVFTFDVSLAISSSSLIYYSVISPMLSVSYDMCFFFFLRHFRFYFQKFDFGLSYIFYISKMFNLSSGFLNI